MIVSRSGMSRPSYLHLASVGRLEPVGEQVVVDEASELEDQLVTDGDAARNTRSTLLLGRRSCRSRGGVWPPRLWLWIP